MFFSAECIKLEIHLDKRFTAYVLV